MKCNECKSRGGDSIPMLIPIVEEWWFVKVAMKLINWWKPPENLLGSTLSHSVCLSAFSNLFQIRSRPIQLLWVPWLELKPLQWGHLPSWSWPRVSLMCITMLLLKLHQDECLGPSNVGERVATRCARCTLLWHHTRPYILPCQMPHRRKSFMWPVLDDS